MLPPIVTKFVGHLTSVVTNFVVITIIGTIVALVLARLLGGKSQAIRQVIFSTTVFASLCFAAYYAVKSA